MLRRAQLGSVLAIATCLAAPARAEAPLAEANRHFQLGVALFKERRFEGALVEFERAHALAPHPLTRLNLGLAYRELGRYDEALDALAAVLVDAGVSPEVAARATQEADALRQRMGTVTITTNSDGAEVTLDGRALGTTPLERGFAVAPGVHVIEAHAATGQRERRSLTIAAGDRATVELTFPPLPPAPAPDAPQTLVLQAPARATPVARPRRAVLGAWAGGIASAAAVDKTGTAVVGAGVRIGRLNLGVDGVLVAWAVVPTVRVRLFGDRVAVHGIAALPIVLKDGNDTDPFVAAAGGLGLTLALRPRALELYAEGLASVAAEPHGLTVPISLGVRAWLD